MSSSHHDDHHLNEQKPVAFTVPLIMASVLILIIVLFLSLCDPKPHKVGEETGEHMAPVEATHHDAAMHEEPANAKEANVTENDSESVETTVPSAEPTKPEHH